MAETALLDKNEYSLRQLEIEVSSTSLPTTIGRLRFAVHGDRCDIHKSPDTNEGFELEHSFVIILLVGCSKLPSRQGELQRLHDDIPRT